MVVLDYPVGPNSCHQCLYVREAEGGLMHVAGEAVGARRRLRLERSGRACVQECWQPPETPRGRT